MSKRPPAPPKSAAGSARAEPPARGGRARAVSELLPAVGGAAFRRFGFVQSSIVSRWAEIAGERYARVSAPESLRFPPGQKTGGTLSLTVQGAHGVTIQHVIPELIERVNRFFGYAAVARIAIRSGTVVPPPRPAPPSLKPVSLDAPGPLGDSLRAVADPELQAVLAALAAGIAVTEGPPVVGSVS